MKINTLTVFYGIAIASFLSAAPIPPPPTNNIWFDGEAQTFSGDGLNWTIVKDKAVTASWSADNNDRAKGWEPEGLPVGNGRIAAMVLDSAARERLALNEISLWTGGENPGGGYGYGPKAGRGEFGSYQPFGEFLAEFPGMDGAQDFMRGLDLETGVAKTSFAKNGVKYTREVFASGPHQVIAVVYRASKKGALSGTFALAPNHDAKFALAGTKGISMSGTLANGMKFCGRAAFIVKGGKSSALGGNADIKCDYTKEGDATRATYDASKLPRIKIEDADEIVVLIAMNTDYAMDAKKNWKGNDPAKTTAGTIASAAKISADSLRADHATEHKKYFSRVTVDFGKTDAETAKLSTPARLIKYKQTRDDPDLEETLFQFGRYCLISSSRGAQPANLQGIWNDKVHAPWACDYHNNINVQEAYWPAEVTNISECHMPLINWLEATVPAATEATKREFKANDGKPIRGWTARTSQNIYGYGGWQWNIPASAWYALHIWEHYAFTEDKEFLKKTAYPMMKEICWFWEDHLKELTKDGGNFFSSEKGINRAELKGIKAGTLVAPNGWSPEHGPREDGVAHDQQLIWELFDITAKAADILGVDKAWAKSLIEKRDRLAKPKIGKEGNLQEWMIDRIAKTQHRHTSHLFGIYPGNMLFKQNDPKLIEGAKKALEWRGSTGDSRRSWSWPWRTALWARFKEGDKCHEMIEGLLMHNTLPNLLTTHPPFQMDGNFSLPAGISEMLVQSQNDYIELLPAPCKAWKDGKVKGLKARGNITVSFEWKGGKVTKWTLSSPDSKKVKVKINGKISETVAKPAKK